MAKFVKIQDFYGKLFHVNIDMITCIREAEDGGGTEIRLVENTIYTKETTDQILDKLQYQSIAC